MWYIKGFPHPERVQMTTSAEFAATFRGDILDPSSPDFDRARRVWNGMIDRRPAYIARCRSVDDVRAAIRFGRESKLAIAIRGGGHNAAGLGVCDGGLVIDLGAMRDVTVDPAERLAHVGGGATWGDLDGATATHGLATTGGAVSTTGIAGLALGGGLGWLMRSYGLTCDNLIAAEVVTASGYVLHVSESEHPDLLWALRGGGGNFGVVTRFTFRLHPVSTILGGMLLYPLARARQALRLYRDVTRAASDRLTVFSPMLHSPDGHPLVGFAICYNGPVDEGEQAIAAIRAFGDPVAGEVGAMPYTALQRMLDEGFPPGLQVHWRSEFLQSLTDDFIEMAVSAYERVPSPLSALLLEQFGGAVRRVPADATAFDQRDADYNLVIVSRWADPADAERNVAWARETSEAARPFTNGRVYVNYIGVGEAPDRVRAAFSPAKFARLVEVKRAHDPENVFRINQNIPVSA